MDLHAGYGRGVAIGRAMPRSVGFAADGALGLGVGRVGSVVVADWHAMLPGYAGRWIGLIWLKSL